MTATTSHGASLPTVVSRSITDVDAYRSAVAGVEIEAVKTGPGTGPNAVRVVSDELITSTSVKIGFPILTRASVGDDRLIVASIQAAPPGLDSVHDGLPMDTGERAASLTVRYSGTVVAVVTR